MSDKLFYKISAYVFIFVGGLHLIRALYGWDAVVGGVEIPVWWSWGVSLAALYLGYRGLSGKKKKR